MEDELNPQIPSVRDPFDLRLCSQLPFPLTPDEDRILQHILRICGADNQMARRAYDSIVCMWAKKNEALTAAVATAAYPNPINVAAIGNNIQANIYGTNIAPGSNILYKGLKGINPSVKNDGFGEGGAGAGPYVSATMDFTNTSQFRSGPIPMAIISPQNVMSNIIMVDLVLFP